MKPSKIVCSDGVRSFAAPARWRGRNFVSRALSLYRRFDFTAVPRSKRRTALRLALEEWSPYSDWAGAAIWSADGHVSAWIWEADRIRLQLELAGSRTATAGALPEALLHGPTGATIDTVRTSEGWLARKWRDGALLGEFFFSDRPTTEDWAAAMLALEADDGDATTAWQAVSAAADAPTPALLWDGSCETLGSTIAANPVSAERLLAVCGVALAIGTVWLVGESLRLHRGAVALEERIATARTEAAPVAQARARALDAADRLRAWAELDRFPTALTLLEAMAQSVPPGVVVSDYRYESGIIRATVSNPGVQMTGDFVTRLQARDAVSSVRVVPAADPRSLQFELEAASLLTAPAGGRP